MAVETLTVTLGVDDVGGKVKGKNLVVADENDNQIVTVLDGGDLSGNYLFEYWGKDTPTESGAGPGGNDVFKFDLSGFNDDFSISVKSMDSLDRFEISGFQTVVITDDLYTFTYTGSDGFSYTFSLDSESGNTGDHVSVTGRDGNILCFARGTDILTPDGEVPVETLAAGDLVICGDGRSHPIRWVGGRKVDAATLRAHPDLCPVRIDRNALGAHRPDKPLRLSPQHKILLGDWRAELLFGEDKVLATAKSLRNDMTIRSDKACRSIEYFHILLQTHQTVFANGLECETLMPAEMMVTALSPEASAEICQLFPEFAGNPESYGSLCSMALKPHEVNTFLALKYSAPGPAAPRGGTPKAKPV
jgi:Hint domain